MTEHTTSYYAASANKYEPFPTLEGSINCDVCVVGGGYTGLSSALHLAEMGYDVVLLEGARIGFGASGRNGGQLVNSYSRDIDVIEKNYGPDAAKMLGSMMFEGGDIIRERIQRYQIQCDYRPGGLFVAMNHKQLETLEEQKANWERYGNTQLELLDREAIRREVDSDRYVGALLDHSALRADVALEHRDAAVLRIRLIDGADDRRIAVFRGVHGFTKRVPRYGHNAKIQ